MRAFELGDREARLDSREDRRTDASVVLSSWDVGGPTSCIGNGDMLGIRSKGLENG